MAFLSTKLPRRTPRLLILPALCLALGACAPTGSLVHRETFHPDPAAGAAPRAAYGATAPDVEPMRGTAMVSKDAHPYRRPQAAPEPQPSNFFDLAHPTVDAFIDYYSDESPEIIARSLARAHPHLPRMKEALSDAGVPEEVVYLPIVESHFKATARSNAGAAGIWQLMPTIAKHFGLRIEPCVDERHDPIRSTEAAAQYLSSLHRRFDDWHLALAAYNFGEGRIYRIMQDNEIDDYWTMVDRSLLPRETAQFVPKFLAAATVAKQPQVFGIEGGATAEDESDTVKISVTGPLSLARIADMAGVERDRIEALNPALPCGKVPASGYPVLLPSDAARPFQLAYAKLDLDEDGNHGIHRVRRGESPASIARRYGVSVRALMRENGIHNPRRLRIDTKLRIPERI